MSRRFLVAANWIVVTTSALALPFFYGYRGAGIYSPIIFAACIAGYAVWTNWRLSPTTGPTKSLLLGFIFAGVATFPAYFVGRLLS
jgi:hypothetical protein